MVSMPGWTQKHTLDISTTPARSGEWWQYVRPTVPGPNTTLPDGTDTDADAAQRRGNEAGGGAFVGRSDPLQENPPSRYVLFVV